MKIKKPKAVIINMALVRKVKELPCRVCDEPGPSDCDHIRTRGSGGGDEITNLWALCRMHHTEKHRIGLKSFAEKYKMPISWENGYPELILTRLEQDGVD